MKLYHLIIQKAKSRKSRDFRDQLYIELTGTTERLLTGMWKDAKDTFKPYKPGQFLRDFIKQPFYGIGNIFLGLLAIPFGLIIGVITSLEFISKLFLYAPFRGPKYVKEMFKDLGKDLALSFLLTVVFSPVRIFRGATQIIAWPFTILRFIIRVPISWFKEAPRIEESKGLNQIILQYNALEANQKDSNTLQVYTYMLLRKYFNEHEKRQNTRIDKERIVEFVKSFNLNPIIEQLRYRRYTALSDNKMLDFYGCGKHSTTDITTAEQIDPVFKFFNTIIDNNIIGKSTDNTNACITSFNLIGDATK